MNEQVGNVLFTSRVEAFPDILERHLPKVGLHGKNGVALHLCECWSVERARELKVWERCSGVLVLIHLVLLLVCRARGYVEHCRVMKGGIEYAVGRRIQEKIAS